MDADARTARRGVPPPAPWGQETVGPTSALLKRIRPDPEAAAEVAVVLGAGGALGPDLVHGLLLRGTGQVVAADIHSTYHVRGADWRRLDLGEVGAPRRFLLDLQAEAARAGRRLGPIFDLAVVQTSPTSGASRTRLSRGKSALLDALQELEGDVRLFHMSSAEVYGSGEGAPFAEDHHLAPINAYGHAKLEEEREALAAHGRPTRGGRLQVTALRTWTITMVNEDPPGAVVSARNYNDPLVTVAERLARAGLRVPVVDPGLLATFHHAEDVVEVALAMGREDAPTWGRPWNCIGRPASHAALRDACFAVFTEGRAPQQAWWTPLLRPLAERDRLPGGLVGATGRLLGGVGALGARDMAGRLPFLYRSLHLDTSALEHALGDRLRNPRGGDSAEAVRRLCLGLRNGGPHALNHRRYRAY